MTTSTAVVIQGLALSKLTRKERKYVQTWLNGEMPPPAWLQPKTDPWGTLEELNRLWEWEPSSDLTPAPDSPTASSDSPDDGSMINGDTAALLSKPPGKSYFRLAPRPKRPLTKDEQAKLGKEIAPLLMLLILEIQNEDNRRFRRPEYKETIDEANSDEPSSRQDPSTAKQVFFRFICLIISILGTSEGAVGGYELVKYLGDIANHSLGGPAGIAFAVVFGLVSLGIVTAVDLSFVANSMGVSYLTAGRELKSIAKEAKEIQKLLEQLETMLKGIKSELNQRSHLEKLINQLNEAVENSESEGQSDQLKERDACEELLKGLKSIEQLNNELQACKRLFGALQLKRRTCEARFTKYRNGFEKTRIKRTIFRFGWIFLTALIYAGSANLTATNVLGLVSAFSPIGLGICAAVATLWICVELFRFYNFERKNIASAMDVVFGTSSSAYCDAANSIKDAKGLDYSNADELVGHQDRIDNALAKTNAKKIAAANDASSNPNIIFSAKAEKPITHLAQLANSK